MTLKKAIMGHMELWNWLSENPEKGKSDWPGWNYNGGKYRWVDNDCFMCEINFSHSNCDGCPLVQEKLWGGPQKAGNIGYCEHPLSAYARWLRSKANLEARSEAAAELALAGAMLAALKGYKF